MFLEWASPADPGGRGDVRYNVLCRRLLPEGRGLEECGAGVRFLPRRMGVTNTSVMVADLQAHTNYSFLLESVNGVSELAASHAHQHVSLNVTTNQAGKLLRPRRPPPAAPHSCGYDSLVFFSFTSFTHFSFQSKLQLKISLVFCEAPPSFCEAMPLLCTSCGFLFKIYAFGC